MYECGWVRYLPLYIMRRNWLNAMTLLSLANVSVSNNNPLYHCFSCNGMVWDRHFDGTKVIGRLLINSRHHVNLSPSSRTSNNTVQTQADHQFPSDLATGQPTQGEMARDKGLLATVLFVVSHGTGHLSARIGDVYRL